MKYESKVVFTATNEEIDDPIYEFNLWLFSRNEDFSSREYITQIEKDIYDFYRAGGRILCGETRRLLPFLNVGKTMGDDDARGLRSYFQEVDGRPKHKPSPLTRERRRVIDVRHRIIRPHVAAKFKR